MTPEERKRYSRQIILPEIGLKGQEKLGAAKVLVVGAGGLGCPVLQYLAAAGVGIIGIVDDDHVELTNLHRQILYHHEDVGNNKAETAAKKLHALNPHIFIKTHPVRLQADNAASIISDYDIIVDGSDNFPTRYLVDGVCAELKKPLVFGSILRFEGQVSVFNGKNAPSYRSLFPDFEEADNCADAGVLGILPGIIGTYMANEVVKLICGIGQPLYGKLLAFNALNAEMQVFDIADVAPAPEVPAFQPDIDHTQQTPLTFEAYETLRSGDEYNVLLIDVREPYEYEADNFGGINIPLSEFPDHYEDLLGSKNIVLYCATGARSQKAAKLLQKADFKGNIHIAANW